MSDEFYNGWTNRETWAVALHINNDQGWQESVLEALREGAFANGTTLLEALADPLYTAQDAAYRAGIVIRENVEDILTAEPRTSTHGVWYMLTEYQYLALHDIGSLWRVDWTELGAALLSDLAEADAYADRDSTESTDEQ